MTGICRTTPAATRPSLQIIWKVKLRQLPILEEDVSRAMSQLLGNKSHGIDTIPAELLKLVPISTIETLGKKDLGK